MDRGAAQLQKNKKPETNSLNGVLGATEVVAQNYKTININQYAKYFGKVAHNFDLMLHGEPGAGKTYFLLRFANYFAEKFGKVLFVSNEEFGTVTLQNKINETNSTSKNLFFSKSLENVNISDYVLVILDSITSMRITLESYIQLRLQHPDTAVIGIMQKNKDGSFRGSKDWEHEFEIAGELIFDDEGKRCIRVYKNRYGVLGQNKI